MNLKAFLFSLILLASSGLKAQLLIGPEAGMNYSWSTFGDKDLNSRYSVRPVPGYSVGGHVGFRVRKRFFLHISMLYSTKGRIIEGKNENLRDQLKLNYIDMPIIYTVDFKGKIGHNKEFKYNIGVGPVVSYWLGGKGVIENDDTNEFNTPESGDPVHYKIVFRKTHDETKPREMSIQSFNRIQLGLALTASIIFEPITHRHIMLTMRYELGGSYLSRTDNGNFNRYLMPGDFPYQEPLATRNKGLRLTLAYLLDTRIDQRKRGKSTYDRRRK